MTERNWQLSFEFFPPKTEQGVANLRHTRKQLAQFVPTFFSVTYGAGGSTRANTQSTVLDITAAALEVAPHLSFGGDSEQAVIALLDSYRDAGIRRLVALRGDLPSGMGGAMQLVHANELVRFIRERFGDLFTLHVAAYPEIHPEAGGYDDDVHWLAEKFKAGADQAITQYFYNVDAYWYFLERCLAKGIERAVVPGVMPITNYRNLVRFSANCGAEIPRWLQRRLEQYGDDTESLKGFGCEVVSQLCEKLLVGGAPGLHFYTMNQLEPTASILANLGEQPR